MNKLKQLPLYLFFLMAGAWITCAIILSSPSDPKNAIVFGYSLERILLAAGLILFTIPLLYWTLKLVKQPEHSQHLWVSLLQNNTLYLLLVLSSLFFLIILLLPPYRLGDFASYISRLYPVLIWLTLVSVVTKWLFFNARKIDSFWLILTEYKISLQMGLISFVVFIILLVLIIFTGIGIRHPEDYWFGAGVPVLGLQVLFSLIIGILFTWLELTRKIKNTFRFDVFLSLALFIFTALLWSREPVLPNFFMPDTADNLMYPYSDSATFDLGSQFALIGQGFFNGVYFDRIFYSSLLTYLHRFIGQDFGSILALQAILFSIFPVLVYLIGKELHSRAFGFAIGTLISLRGINAILAATWINLAGPKLMTTDFPTAIGIALFLLFAIKWIKASSKLHYIVLAGGMLGLTMMLRTHVLFLAFAFILYILIVSSKLNRNVRWLGSLALILGMLTATTPWDLRNLSNGTPMFYLYYSRIQTVLEARYGIEGDSYLPSDEKFTSEATLISQRQRVLKADESGCEGLPCKIINHFFHNIIASFLFLPSSFIFDGLWNTVKEGAPYWQAGWKGLGVNFTQWLFIGINLILISLGIGMSWSKQKWLGMLPLIIFFVYMGTNALALTSAGRYVAPVDWIICLYYALGLFQVLLWSLHHGGILPESSEKVEVQNEAHGLTSIQYRGALSALILIFGIGSLVPLAEMPFAKRYQINESQTLLSKLGEVGLIEQSGFSESEYLEFLSQPNAMIIEGRALYPRYYLGREGEPDRSTYYRRLDYPRLVFTLIGPYATEAQGVVIAGDKPNSLIHAEDVIVIGCWNTTYYAPFIDAVVVFVLSDEGYVYTRNPVAKLVCPLPEPRE